METKSYTNAPAETAGESDPQLVEAPVAGESEFDHARLPMVEPDRYMIGEEIARGGMGRVVEARDRRLGRNVAIKEMLPHDRARRYRFEREVRITARLQHPSIIRVYEAGVWPDGKPFYAMTRVTGRSLDKVIAEHSALAGRLRLLPHVIAAVDAIAYAHAQHVIHRDLKPANVLVGDYGETVVIDWGLAKHQSEGAPDSDPATQATDSSAAAPLDRTASGSVVGTPNYMPPEQARGEPVDARADVYSLGAMLYEVLTGVPPFAHGSPEWVRARLIQGPPTPIRQREPNVPLDLAAIVDKAMARDRDTRYPGAAEFVADLKRFETGQLVAARHYSPGQRFLRFLRRRALAVSFAAVLVVIGALSIVRITASRNEALAAQAVATARNDALVLLQARAELTRDPTSSLAWLKRYPATAPGWDEARAIASDAWSRGVAHDVWNFGRPIGSLAFSPDSRTLAVGALDGSLTFIDLETGHRQTSAAPEGSSDRLVFSPDSTLVATSDGHETVRIWDRATGSSHRLPGEHVGGLAMHFSPDGSFLVVRHLGGDWRTHVWRMPGGEPVPLPGSDNALVAFVPHSRTVASANGTELSLIDLDTSRTLARMHVDQPPTELAVSGDGQWIAGAQGEALALWNPATSTLRSVHTGKNVVSVLDASADGAHIVTCGVKMRELWLFDVAASTTRKLSTDETCNPKGSGFSPDGKLYLSTGLGGELRLHLLSGGQTRLLFGHQAAVTDAAFSADGRYLASASTDHTVRLWKWSDGDRQVLYDTTSPDRISLTGRLLASDANHELSVLDVQTGKREPIRDMPEHVVDTSLSPSGRVVAFLVADGSVSRYDLSTGRQRKIAFPELWVAPGVAPSALSADGDRLAQIDPRGVVRLFDLGSGQIRELAHLGDVSFAMAFSANGKLLAFGSRDGTLRVVDSDTGIERVKLQLHGIVVWYLSFSTDGTRVGAACADGLVRVIDIANAEVHELSGHVGTVGGVDLSADGSEVVSSGVDGTVRIWDLATRRGIIVHREPFPVTSVHFVPGTSLVVERGHDSFVFRVWDIRAVPSLMSDRMTLVRWIGGATTAEVDEEGTLATP